MARTRRASGEATTTPQDSPASEEKPAAARKPRQTRRGPGGRRGAGASETGRLIEALLKSRGAKGASQQELEQVVRWAQGIQSAGAAIDAEAAELRKVGPRGRKTTGA